MSRRDLRCLAAGASLLCVVACKSRKYNDGAAAKSAPEAHAFAAGLDVNDVSVLYPKPKNRQQLEKMRTGDDAAADGTPLFPQGLFDQIVKLDVQPPDSAQKWPMALFERTGSGLAGVKITPLKAVAPEFTLEGVGGAKRSDWKWVGVRFTACGVKPPGEDCLPSVRIVLQPVALPGDSDVPMVGDSGIHLIYELPSEKLPELAQGLLSIKRAETSGRPLSAHPMISWQGYSGEFNQGLVALVKKTLAGGPAPNGYLKHFAMLGLHESTFAWSMFGGFVVDKGFVFFAQQTNDAVSMTSDIVFGGDSPVPTGHMSSNGHPSTVPIFEGRENTSYDDFKSVGVIESPTRGFLLPTQQKSPAHVDCISCHSTTSRVLAVGKDIDRKGPPFSAYTRARAESGFKPPAGITAYAQLADLQESRYNLHNFGIFGGTPQTLVPSISVRVVNESALEADAFNKILGLPNPGLTCDDAKTWQCILSGQTDCLDTPRKDKTVLCQRSK